MNEKEQSRFTDHLQQADLLVAACQALAEKGQERCESCAVIEGLLPKAREAVHVMADAVDGVGLVGKRLAAAGRRAG